MPWSYDKASESLKKTAHRIRIDRGIGLVEIVKKGINHL